MAKKYLPAICKLYYSVLAQQIPPSKIPTIIKSVLKCFLTGLDVTNLQLPKEHCAGYSWLKNRRQFAYIKLRFFVSAHRWCIPPKH